MKNYLINEFADTIYAARQSNKQKYRHIVTFPKKQPNRNSNQRTYTREKDTYISWLTKQLAQKKEDTHIQREIYKIFIQKYR